MITKVNSGDTILASKFNELIDAVQTLNITYSELVTKRDNGELVPGAQYRITDYVCTVNSELTDARAVTNQFDIIVIADSENTLNENAFATLHADDNYFSQHGCKLESWELKYCLDNDRTRFEWADPDNGKGVIYWMKDEWNNECAYDFKNIQFKRYKIDSVEKTALSDLVGKYGIDGGYQYTVDTSEPYWCYTFCMIDLYDDNSHDLSVEQNKYRSDEGFCYKTHDIVFRSYVSSFYNEETDESMEVNKLANNVFVTDTDICAIESDYSYGEFYGFYSNTFGNNNHDNTFGNSCYENTFGNSCYENTFGNGCGNNTFGNETYWNTFGNNNWNNTFGNYCQSNTFGNECSSNTFGNGCGNNTFGNNNYRNTFGNNNWYNTFGNGCNYNTFGNSCSRNTFGNECRYNTFGNYFYYNTIENDMQYCDLTNYTTSSSRTGYLMHVHFLNGLYFNSLTQITGLTVGAEYCQFVGKTTSGSVTIKNPMD